MKKKLLFLGFILLGFVSTPVLAAEEAACGIFSKYLNTAARIIMIAAPILLILMGTIDGLKAVAASDDKAFKTAWSNFVKRLIICLIIYFLPVFINLIIGFTTLNDLTACI